MSFSVRFERVSKSFRRGSARYRSLRDDLSSLLMPWSWARRRETFWALRDVSFDVPPGGALGIIGPNGSGKSTTLKLIARITHPTEGTIRIRGRVGALIEVGAGIHPELTGRENIYVSGTILGLRRREIQRKFDEIVEFAGIGPFVDTPVKHYSSGMQVRLGFAVAAHMDVDVLLVDEVLAVGDASFQTKCLQRIRELRDSGTTILLVSHQLSNVQRICKETLLLLEGRVAALGPTPEVISQYYRYLDEIGSGDPEAAVQGGARVRVPPNTPLRITAVRLLDREGRERATFQMGEDLTVRVEYAAHTRIERPNVSVSFNSSDWTVYTGVDTRNEGFVIPFVEGGGAVELEIPQLGLGPGLYEVNVGVWDETLTSPYDWRWGIRRFVVDTHRPLFAGRFVLPHRWSWRPAPPGTAPAAIPVPSREDTAALDRFQEALLGAVHSFLNGEFVVPASTRGELLRPLDLRASRVPWDVLEPPVAALRALGGNSGGQVRELAEEGASQRALPFGRAAELLSALYGELDRRTQDSNAGEAVRVLRGWDPDLYRERGLRAVVRLGEYVQEALTPHLLGFYLHGSLSTLDYTPFSDLDDLLILRRETVLDPERLMECARRCVEAARFLYEHDPLQHHGHFVLTELDLRRYPHVHIPPEVLPYATVVVGPTEITLAARDGSATFRRAAHHLAERLTRTTPPRNLWELKDILARVMLLPVLYLGALGQPCYKKFAFERAKPSFDGSWRAVEVASVLREAWPYRPSVRERALLHLVLARLSNPALFQRLAAKHAQPVPPDIAARLEREDFYGAVRRFGASALRLLEGSG